MIQENYQWEKIKRPIYHQFRKTFCYRLQLAWKARNLYGKLLGNILLGVNFASWLWRTQRTLTTSWGRDSLNRRQTRRSTYGIVCYTFRPVRQQNGNSGQRSSLQRRVYKHACTYGTLFMTVSTAVVSYSVKLQMLFHLFHYQSLSRLRKSPEVVYSVHYRGKFGSCESANGMLIVCVYLTTLAYKRYFGVHCFMELANGFENF